MEDKLLKVKHVFDKVKNMRSELNLLFNHLDGRICKLSEIYDEFIKTPELVMDNLWRFVTSVDGHTQAPIIAKIIPKLPITDRHKLINAIVNIDCGVDTKVKFECDECQRVNIVDLPLTEDFFTVK